MKTSGMTPDIQHLGHACISFRHGGFTLVSDPWFYPAFLSSWFPCPDNRSLIELARIASCYYISHAHEDHFDRRFLSRLPLSTRFIIPRFRSGYLEREIRKLGFADVTVLAHGESLQAAPEIRLTMLTDRSHKEDSALLIETPGFRFLNSNDCECASSDWPKDINLLACQFSGAFWYPHCYDFPPDVQARKVTEVRDSNFRRLCRRVRLTGARSYLPSAGPAVFLDPELAPYNHTGGIFPRWAEIDWQFAREFPDVAIWPHLNDFTDLGYYRERRREEWESWQKEPDTAGKFNEVYDHFISLQKLNRRFLRDWGKDVGLKSGDGNWQVRLGLLRGELEESFHPGYFLDVPPRVLRAVLDGRATWETALLSMRVRLRRDPDIYDSTLMGLLAFGDRPVQTVTMARQQASDEMIIRGALEFQRWCPHAAEDLSDAPVEGDVVTCPRHEYRWNARTGECLTGQDIPLRTGKKER